MAGPAQRRAHLRSPRQRRRRRILSRTPFASVAATLFSTASTVAALALLLVFPIVGSSSTSPSSTSTSPPYNVYNYDLTTPLFAPDGRLLQVEYASVAPSLSSPLVAAPVVLPNGGGCAVVMAAIVAPSSPPPEGDEDENANKGDTNGREGDSGIVRKGEDNDKKQMATRRKRLGQSRLVELPVGPPSSYYSAAGASTTPSVVLGLSGVLPDCASLVARARNDLATYHQTYGLHAPLLHTPSHGRRSGSGRSVMSTPSSASRRLALVLADACQERSFGGGIRPYGSAVLTCGCDETGCVLGVTDPSGAVRLWRFDDDGEERCDGDGYGADPDTPAVVVTGGDARTRERVRDAVSSRIRSNVVEGTTGRFSSSSSNADVDAKESDDDGKSTVLRRALHAVVASLLEEDLRSREGSIGGLSKKLRGDDVESSSQGDGPFLEVVLVTPYNGVHRLSDDQIGRIVDRVRQDGTATDVSLSQ